MRERERKKERERERERIDRRNRVREMDTLSNEFFLFIAQFTSIDNLSLKDLVDLITLPHNAVFCYAYYR